MSLQQELANNPAEKKH